MYISLIHIYVLTLNIIIVLLESHFIITIIILQKYYNALSENGIRYKS